MYSYVNAQTFYGNQNDIKNKLTDLLLTYWKWVYKWDPIYNTAVSRRDNVITPEDIVNRWMTNCIYRNGNDTSAIITDLLERLNQAGFQIDLMANEDGLVGIVYVDVNDQPELLERFRAVAEHVKAAGISFRAGYIA